MYLGVSPPAADAVVLVVVDVGVSQARVKQVRNLTVHSQGADEGVIGKDRAEARYIVFERPRWVCNIIPIMGSDQTIGFEIGDSNAGCAVVEGHRRVRYSVSSRMDTRRYSLVGAENIRAA